MRGEKHSFWGPMNFPGALPFPPNSVTSAPSATLYTAIVLLYSLEMAITAPSGLIARPVLLSLASPSVRTSVPAILRPT